MSGSIKKELNEILNSEIASEVLRSTLSDANAGNEFPDDQVIKIVKGELVVSEDGQKRVPISEKDKLEDETEFLIAVA